MKAGGRRGKRAEVLVATLGTEPQVVTITLDQLLAGGRAIGEAVVVHTNAPRVAEALGTVEAEFAKGVYPDVALRKAPVLSAKGAAVDDFRDDEDLRALLRTLYAEVRRARQGEVTVHLCVSGGRKVMGIMGMVVAQLLFGPEDCVWHLVTEGWQPGGERRLHLAAGEEVWLVPVPVIRWAEAGTLVRTVAELDDPAEVVAWYERLRRQGEMREKRGFIHHWLTEAQWEVVRLACQGLPNAAIARELGKSEQTVANQLREVYGLLREWLGFPEYEVDRSVLIAQFAPYFAWEGEG